MKLLCEQCFKPKCKHNTEKFECDDLLVSAIQKLNKLGYKTLFSCSGHTYTGDSHEAEIIDGDKYMLQTYIVLDKIYDVPFLSPNIDFKLLDLYINVDNEYVKQRKLVIENIQWFYINDINGQNKFIKQNVKNINKWIKKVEDNEILPN